MWNNPALRKRLFRILLKAGGISVLIWLGLVLSLSAVYVQRLTNPGCPAAGEPPQGYRSVSVQVADRFAVRGWWREPENGVVVILFGGHGAGRDSLLPEANVLARHGYGVLTIEPRACAGQAATLGAREVEELQAAVGYARSQPGVQHVAVLGFSAGGVAAILSAAALPEIDAVIAQGNYANLWGEIANSGAAPLSLEWQIERLVGLLIWLRTGVWPADVSPIQALPAVQPRPVLLIHGEREAQNNQAQAQFDAAGSPKALWIVPGAGHGGYREAAPEEFERQMLRFLESAFPQAARR